MRRQLTFLTACFTLIAACSGTPEEIGPAPRNQLPADAVVTANPAGKGIQRLEAHDLGAMLATGTPYQQALADGNPGIAVQQFVASYPEVFGAQGVAPDFSVRSSTTDALGITLVRLDQRYEGLPVFGGELLAHFSDNRLIRVIGDYITPLVLDSTSPANPESAAFTVAVSAVDGLQDCSRCSARLGVYQAQFADAGSAPTLVWEVDAGASQINSWRLRIDAHSLEILDKKPTALSAGL